MPDALSFSVLLLAVNLPNTNYLFPTILVVTVMRMMKTPTHTLLCKHYCYRSFCNNVFHELVYALIIILAKILFILLINRPTVFLLKVTVNKHESQVH